ncbi:MAG TPA: FemAB family XrtA/PEP-CTERM system-associated protein [Pirellulaceae bacterium]|nr:FemAB family XrtA/PEP-CTERM system-associated protein [Pirellulaceae bacterium]
MQTAITASAAVRVHGLGDLDSGGNEAASSPAVAAALADAKRWLRVLHSALGHSPYLLCAEEGQQNTGVLPLAVVQSALFGRFLVSLPYVNSAGIVADSAAAAGRLLDRAVQLADELNVRYLELRNEQQSTHASLEHKNDSKVLMRLPLPATPEKLLASFKSKLRSQIRSGEKHNFDVRFGGRELLADFYAVFSRNMRDLGTPVYSRRLFEAILELFAEQAELCVLRLAERPVAAALLLHHAETTEVPSASSLRAYNSTNANMVMYWHLLKRAVERGQAVFDFGRSTVDSGTYRFKEQWGAEPSPSVWQYYLRRGSIGDLRPDNARFSLAIRAWQRLPVWLTRLIGPPIVRGIP